MLANTLTCPDLGVNFIEFETKFRKIAFNIFLSAKTYKSWGTRQSIPIFLAFDTFDSSEIHSFAI